ncbi:hypothetical protein B0H14DRAFT_3514389 [Mycena olivaceomarginata]|nr:hypothetical protein B0H14DRAFT_3514389 [Mycena olivaceomarginata]
MSGTTRLLAIITPCSTSGEDAANELNSYPRMTQPILTDLQTIVAVVVRSIMSDLALWGEVEFCAANTQHGLKSEYFEVGATLAPIIVATDKTQLRRFGGDKQAWPVPSARAIILIGYIPVPMDIDRARTRMFPRTCFRCGAAGHLARECPVTSDVRHTDVLDEVVRQLGDDLLNELFARLSTSASLPAESVDGDETDPAGFSPFG